MSYFDNLPVDKQQKIVESVSQIEHYEKLTAEGQKTLLNFKAELGTHNAWKMLQRHYEKDIDTYHINMPVFDIDGYGFCQYEDNKVMLKCDAKAENNKTVGTTTYKLENESDEETFGRITKWLNTLKNKK